MVIQHGQKAQDELHGAVRHPQGQALHHLFQVPLELAKPQVGLAGEEIGQEEDQAAGVGQPRSQGGAQDLQVQVEDEDIVQADVDDEADGHADHGQLRPSVHLHHHLQAVGEDDTHGEEAHHVEILGGIADGQRTGAQKIGQRLGKHGHRHADDSGDNEDHHHDLGE